MIKEKKIILFTDDYCSYSEEEAKENLLYNDLKEEEITDDMINDEIQEMININCYDLESSIKHWDKEHKGRVLLIGSLGLWNGRKRGGKICDSLEDAVYSCIEDTNTLYQTRKNGTLKIEAIHHDGSNYFELYELTTKGEQYILDHYYSMSDEKLHSQLLRPERTKAIHFEIGY